MNDPVHPVWVATVCTLDLVVVAALNETQQYLILGASLDYLYVGRRLVAKISWHSQMFTFIILMHHLIFNV